MNKNDAVTFLRKKGYNAENDRGVVIVLYEGKNTKTAYNEILKLLRENGYFSSFGMKPGVNVSKSNSTNEEIITESNNVGNVSVNEDIDEDFDNDYIEENEETTIFTSDESEISYGYVENGDGQLSFL